LVAELLYQAGFKSAEEVAESELEEILDIEGVSKDRAEALHKSAKEYVAEKRRKEEEDAARAAEQAATAETPVETSQEKEP
jgi:transcription termination factor NusA